MSKRVPVAYATRTGSTVDVAAAIGEALSGRGLAVDVKPVKDNPILNGYEAVVIGSAVNGGQWLPEAVEFVKSNQGALNQVPVALFCVYATNLGDDENSRKRRLAYPNAVRPLVMVVDEVFFAAMGFDPKRGSWLEGLLARMFKVSEGDLRDWGDDARLGRWSGSQAVSATIRAAAKYSGFCQWSTRYLNSAAIG